MRKNTFFDFFPTPKFLNIPYAGISISDTAVRAILFSHAHGKSILKQYIEKPLGEGVVSGGFVHKPEDVVKALSEIKKTLGISYVKATLPEEKGYLFNTTIPKVKGGNVSDAIGFTLEENAPVKAAEAVYDHVVLSEEGEKISVAVSVLPLKVVSTYCNMIENAGLTPLSLEIESQAIASALIARGDNRTYLILNCEAMKTGFYIVSSGVVLFSSTGEMEEAQLSQEIKRLQAYWQTTDISGIKNKKIEKVLVCGEEANKEGVIEKISKDIALEVVRGNVWTNAFSFDEHIPKLSFEDSLAFAAAAGLALSLRL